MTAALALENVEPKVGRRSSLQLPPRPPHTTARLAKKDHEGKNASLARRSKAGS